MDGECMGCGGVGNWCDCGEDDEEDQVVVANDQVAVVESILPNQAGAEQQQYGRPSDDGGTNVGPVAQV